jgi:Peptidase C10 family/Carboxypeptidase regulatory-like domain/Spi protease inhibitor
VNSREYKERMMVTTRWHKLAGLCPLAILILPAVLLFWWCGAASAAPVTAERVHKLTGAWVAAHPRPLNSRLGSQVDSVETFADANGQPIYYIVYLRPNGFVIAPADDLVEPIIGFAPAGSYDPSDRNPLGALVSRDLPGRVNAARAVEQKIRSRVGLTQQEAAIRRSGEDASGKWKKLAGETADSSVLLTSLSNVSDIRVSPLLQSKWSQTNVCSNACYNYYVPPYGDGNTSNYPCGCVATAMAQYMRFWQYPTTGVGTGCFTVKVDGTPTTKCLRGGDGSGGAYNWTDMTLVPGCGTTLTQRQAIGALTYDAGVAVNMQYAPGGSGAYMDDADAAITNIFGYSNSIYGYNDDDNIASAALNAMINPNLDWGNPVMLGIYNSSTFEGHAIVADGYGYSSSTLYHHLNLGWAGNSDAWYNLPNIDSSYSFNVVDSAIYNVYRSGSGEIISGRVLASDTNLPIAGATVTAIKTGGGTYSAVTNSNGIYAIAQIPSSSTYTVSAARTGYSFISKPATTGLSQDYQPASGNCWAVDLTGTLAGPVPVASDSNATAEAGVPQTITLQALDDGEPNPPGALTYIITSLPHHGTLADPCVGSIGTVPYSLANHGNNVIYTPLVCYTGSDSFQFRANDGGTAPTGGDSNIATVSITVQPPSSEVFYETHFDTGLPAGWTIIHGGSGSSSDTWRSDNPGNRTNSNWTGVFMIVDSRYAGSVDMNEQLITHSINCTGLINVKLRFKHYFRHWVTEIGDVDIRVNGGVWQNAARYQGVDYSGLVELALSGFQADGDPNVQIRWRYYNANHDYYWGIDDVQIVANSVSQVTLVGDFDSDCDVDYDDLVIFTSAWLTSSGQPNWNPACDIAEPNDGVINECDFAVFAGNWMVGVE